MFGIIVFMFSLSTAYLAVSIADLIVIIKTWYLQGYLFVDLSESAGTRRPTGDLLVLFNALAVINVGDDLTLTLFANGLTNPAVCSDGWRRRLASLDHMP